VRVRQCGALRERVSRRCAELEMKTLEAKSQRDWNRGPWRHRLEGKRRDVAATDLAWRLLHLSIRIEGTP